jgi:ArsR family transcriptional regulator
LERFTEIFKALADPTRLRIVHLLLHSKIELCGCELVDSLEEPQYNISRHLKELKNADLIKVRKESRWVYYQINNKDLFKENIFKTVFSLSHPLLSKDKAELKKRLPLRVKGKCLIGIQKKDLLKGK